ncbi:MAG: hypothetical protein LC754_16225, partial [Acidobacteria bacterium]|nr:hypothetical protein [Acidobacteriota bacterium]
MQQKFIRRSGVILQPKHIKRVIARVAEKFESPEAFDRKAREEAAQFPREDIWELTAFFHNPPDKPDEVRDEFNNLGEWMEVCQDAVFAILYHIGEASLPILDRFAFGTYDWTQVKALRTLCRLANQGIQTEKIVGEILFNLPYLEQARDQAIYYLAGVKCDLPELKEAIAREIAERQAGDPVAALSIIGNLANVSPEAAKEYADFLRGLMR